jgi:hypothetical protein
MSDLSSSSLNLLQYADDIALTHQARKFEECAIHLGEGLKILRSFFRQWRLRPSKTQGSILRTRYANRKLTVQFDNIHSLTLTTWKILEWLWTERFPIKHIWKTGMKVSSRVNLVWKLSGTKWGLGAHTLRTALFTRRLNNGHLTG